jgi:thiol-disulfide isomerase/thioredoxin
LRYGSFAAAMGRNFLFVIFFLASCNNGSPPALQTGLWRGELSIQGKKLPFTFSVEPAGKSLACIIHNGSERIVLDSLVFSGDSVRIFFPVFDASLCAHVSPTELNGYFTIHYAEQYIVPFHARKGLNYRFIPSDTTRQMQVNFTGTYSVHFINPSNQVPAIALIQQKGNYATASFLTPTGDYRFLEGNVISDTLWLSAFDGNHLYLFNAVLRGDSITGTHWLGRSRNRPWRGVRNEHARLPAPDSLTYLNPGFEKLTFAFPDPDGKPVSLEDEPFRNKVVIVQILGTWCPNCVDETQFLVKWYPEYKKRGVEIIGLAYEQKEDFSYASSRVKQFRKKLGVPYPILIAGVSDNSRAAETLPALNAVVAFPTTIFIGKDGKVKHIHTGFSGPGTGRYYHETIEQFNDIVNRLLNESSVHHP